MPAWSPASGPELRIPNAAAQTRMVSAGGFWPSKRQLSQHLKYMARARISEFESYMPSTQSGLCWLCPGLKKLARQALITEMSRRLPNQLRPVGADRVVLVA